MGQHLSPGTDLLPSTAVTSNDAAPKSRFLALHDYGMGGVWWWIHARSAREILETFAWIEVVTDPETVARQREDGELEEVDIDAPRMPPGLDGLRATRRAQRGRPGFGALADRDVVYLRRRWDDEDDEDPAVCLMEVSRDGRRLRQVEPPRTGRGQERPRRLAVQPSGRGSLRPGTRGPPDRPGRVRGTVGARPPTGRRPVGGPHSPTSAASAARATSATIKQDPLSDGPPGSPPRAHFRRGWVKRSMLPAGSRNAQSRTP